MADVKELQLSVSHGRQQKEEETRIVHNKCNNNYNCDNSNYEVPFVSP